MVTEVFPYLRPSAHAGNAGNVGNIGNEHDLVDCRAKTLVIKVILVTDEFPYLRPSAHAGNKDNAGKFGNIGNKHSKI